MIHCQKTIWRRIVPFKEVLDELVSSIPEAIGAIIVDNEGENVQLVSKINDYEVKIIGAYQAIQLESLKAALVDSLNCSDAQTFITRAEEMDVISMRIDPEYTVSLVLSSGSLIGPAEFMMKRKLPKLKELM